MNIETLSQCPVCESPRIRHLPVPGRWIGEEVFGSLHGRLGLSRCRACGFAFGNPRPDAVALTRFYTGNTYVCHDAASEDSERGSGYLLPLLGVPRGRLLDFGCGAGGFLAQARAAGWDVAGFEPGGRGRAACAARGVPVTGEFGELLPNSFSAITAIHVFEHVPDLRQTLSGFRKLLAPSGRLCLEVPNAQSLRARLAKISPRFDERYRAFPIHLSYFTPRSIRRLLTGEGWKIEKLTTVGFGLDELAERKPGTPKVAKPNTRPRPLLRRLVRNAFMGSGLGENLVAVCRPAWAAGVNKIPA